MEGTNITLIIEIFGLILGGGGIIGFAVGFATFKWQRMKARGEARQAELEATKVEQDTYQEIITDLKEHNDELRKYNGELKEDRRQLRKEREELRKNQEQQDEKISYHERQIARLGHRLDAVTPLICTLTGCKKRVRNYMGLVSDESFEPHNSHSVETEDNCDRCEEEFPSDDSEETVTNRNKEKKK